MKLILIAAANLRKKKGAAISLGILIMLASLLLSIGLDLSMHSASFFQSKMDTLHSPQNVILISGNLYMPEYSEFFESKTEVEEVETEEVIAMDVAASRFGQGAMEMGAVFQNAGRSRTMLPFHPIEKIEVDEAEAIYLPIGIKDRSPALGEPLAITYKHQEYQFIVAGYFETTTMGTSNGGCVRYYLPDAAYQKLYDEVGGSKMISVRLNDPAESAELQREFKELTGSDLADDIFAAFRFTYDDILYVGTVTPHRC